MKRYKLFTNLIFILIIISILSFTACDSRDFVEPPVEIDRSTQYHIVSLETDSWRLYDDNGATSITLEAMVQDDYGRSVVGQTVRFSPSITQLRFYPAVEPGQGGGTAPENPNSVFISDGSGSVKAITRLSGRGALPAQLDSMLVTVSVWLNDETEPQRSITLTLYKEPSIARIDFDTVLVPSTVGLLQKFEINAKPFDSEGNSVADGVPVTFVTRNKSWFEDANGVKYTPQITVPCSGGLAITSWVSGTSAGRDTLYAKIGNIVSTERIIVIQTGIPSIITFDETEDTVNTNAPAITLRTTVTDRYGNICASKIVRFKSKAGLEEDAVNIGDITASRNTDAFGVAEATFTPGRVAGNAYITATCGDSASAMTMITIQSTIGKSLQFINMNPIELTVQGTGGVESAQIGVQVLDDNANPVTIANRIKFSVLSAPPGVTIDGTAWQNPNAPKIVDTFSGVATIAIAAGRNSGTIKLRAELLGPNDASLFPPLTLDRNNISVNSGPPTSWQLLLPNETNGVPVGAGAWKIIIGANITDTYNNPVLAGTAVSFQLLKLRKAQDGTPEPSIDQVTIIGSAYVGNRSADDDSTAGVAYSTITYHGSYSNWLVDVKIGVSEADTMRTTLKLPMQSPSLDVVAQPSLIQWMGNEGVSTNPTRHSYHSTVLNIKVIDGQNNRIFNAPLDFTANAGYFPNPDTPGGSYPNGFGAFRDVAQKVQPTATDSPEYPTEGQLDDSPGSTKERTPFQAVTDRNGTQLKRYYYRADLFNFEEPAVPKEGQVTIYVQILGVENTLRTVELIVRSWLATPQTIPVGNY